MLFLSCSRVDRPSVQVMVITHDPARVDEVRAAVCGWPAQATVEHCADAFRALRSAREQRAQLVIVDAARAAAPGAVSIAWPWPSLPLVLDEWVQLHLNGADPDAEALP